MKDPDLQCPICHKPFKPAYDDVVKAITGYLFEPDCDHYAKDVQVSVG